MNEIASGRQEGEASDMHLSHERISLHSPQSSSTLKRNAEDPESGGENPPPAKKPCYDNDSSEGELSDIEGGDAQSHNIEVLADTHNAPSAAVAHESHLDSSLPWTTSSAVVVLDNSPTTTPSPSLHTSEITVLEHTTGPDIESVEPVISNRSPSPALPPSVHNHSHIEDASSDFVAHRTLIGSSDLPTDSGVSRSAGVVSNSGHETDPSRSSSIPQTGVETEDLARITTPATSLGPNAVEPEGGVSTHVSSPLPPPRVHTPAQARQVDSSPDSNGRSANPARTQMTISEPPAPMRRSTSISSIILNNLVPLSGRMWSATAARSNRAPTRSVNNNNSTDLTSSRSDRRVSSYSEGTSNSVRGGTVRRRGNQIKTDKWGNEIVSAPSMISLLPNTSIPSKRPVAFPPEKHFEFCTMLRPVDYPVDFQPSKDPNPPREQKAVVFLSAKVFPNDKRWVAELKELSFGGLKPTSVTDHEKGLTFEFPDLASCQHAALFFPKMRFKEYSMDGAWVYPGYKKAQRYKATLNKLEGKGGNGTKGRHGSNPTATIAPNQYKRARNTQTDTRTGTKLHTTKALD